MPPGRHSEKSRWEGYGRAGAAAFTASIALFAAATACGDAGTIRRHTFSSAALREAVPYLVYLPREYAASDKARVPVIYLLHGRGDSMEAWRTVAPDLDRLIETKQIPPLIAVMPDAPWSRRGSYYIDSQATDGRPVETAFTAELIRHIDATLPTIAERSARIVAGYSMGGYGALRYALAHPEVFSAAIILSPAVYVPLPPRESSTREFGAFGKGRLRFDEATYRAKNYPALLSRFGATGASSRMYIAVGDDESVNADPDEARHDLDYEAHTLYNQLRRTPGIAAELRVVNGGHDWNTWRPAFLDGLTYVFRARRQRDRVAIAPVGATSVRRKREPSLAPPGE